MKFGYGFNKNSSVNGGFNIRSTHPVALWMFPNLIDNIGKSISELYPLVGPLVGPIVSADGGTTKRADADIVTLALASDHLNQFNMDGVAGRFVAIYDKDAPFAALEQARKYAKVVAWDWPESDIYYDFNMLERARYGNIAWAGTPTIDADGVTAGNGPSFSDVIAWTAGKDLTIQIKATKASDGITGDEQVFGPLYLRNGYLVAKDGTNEAVLADTWSIGDVISVVIQTGPDMRVGRIS